MAETAETAASPELKTFKGMTGRYVEYAQRGSQTLAFSVKPDPYFGKSLIVRFALRSSDGQFGSFSYLSQRSSSNYQTKDGGHFIGARMNKYAIPVTEGRITQYQLIQICREHKLFEKLAEFLVEIAVREGFGPLVTEDQLAFFIDGILSGPTADVPVIFELPGLNRHEPQGVQVYGSSSHHTDEEDEEGEDSDDED
jgi:hypothetical protein